MARIVLMEDEAETAIRLKALLENVGHEVEWFTTGSEALAAIVNTRFDLLITDIFVRENGLPLSDGGIALAGGIMARTMLPEDAALKPIPIIAMSAAKPFGGFDPLESAKNLGVRRTIRKPFGDEEFLQMLREVLEPV